MGSSRQSERSAKSPIKGIGNIEGRNDSRNDRIVLILVEMGKKYQSASSNSSCDD